MNVAVNAETLLVHAIGGLVTAPEDVTIGENRIEPNVTSRRFSGRITGAWKTIE